MTQQDLAPPPAARRDNVVEITHGHAIIDPYRWLEDGTSADTRDWVEAENRYTRTMLDRLPGRTRLAARLKEHLTIGDLSLPAVRGTRYFYERRDGEQNQPVLYLRQDDTPDRVLLDPNRLNPEGTTALDWWYPSRDGRLIAYGLSEGGDERSVLRILDVDSGTDAPDQIPNTRAASLAWLPDSSGFYYTRYPELGDVPADEEVYHRHVMFHVLGADPADDLKVFGEGRDPTDWPNISLSANGEILTLTVNRGWDRSDCYFRLEAEASRGFSVLIEDEAVLSLAWAEAGRIFLLSNLDAPRNRLFEIDPHHPERRSWRELVCEHPTAVLEDVHIGGGLLFLTYLERATSRLEVRNLAAGSLSEIPLPGIGTVSGVSGEWDGKEAFFGFASFTTPPTILRYDIPTAELEVWAHVEVGLDTAAYEVRQVTYLSRDQTPISMFVIGRRDLQLDSSHPLVLSGYGGFNISMTPNFSRSLLFWLERGGVYAVPNLRGGGEYGEPWHQAGMLANKQNVFDDFVAAAEYLCSEGYTSRDHLAISGGSNGGLLVGAAITQHPELFRAAVCAVPLLDMLRYHQFQIARLWVAEYGSAEDPEQFAWLMRYSPYQHVASARYPAVLLLTSEGDSRVDPLHARKMAARLQAETTSGLPVLLRVETEAGHGAGRPLTKTLAEQTDVWSFLCWQLGLPLC